MAVNAIGSGTISFGLVTIPVKVYSASRTTESISFNLLHKDCGSRLKQQYICPEHDQVVERGDMVKGYEFSKNQYVLFSDEELKAIEEKSTQSIEIAEFVPSSTVDPLFFDKAYYLGPDRHGPKAYSLLAKAMEETGQWAIARYLARGRQYLVVLRPYQGGMIMQQLHYPDEVRAFSDVGIETSDVKDAELKLAILLAEQVATDSFHPDQYRDERRDRLRELIQRKVAGEEISLAPVEETKGEVIDLMAALKASLGTATARPARGGSRPAAAKASERKPARSAPRRLEAVKSTKRKSSK